MLVAFFYLNKQSRPGDMPKNFYRVNYMKYTLFFFWVEIPGGPDSKSSEMRDP